MILLMRNPQTMVNKINTYQNIQYQLLQALSSERELALFSTRELYTHSSHKERQPCSFLGVETCTLSTSSGVGFHLIYMYKGPTQGLGEFINFFLQRRLHLFHPREGCTFFLPIDKIVLDRLLGKATLSSSFTREVALPSLQVKGAHAPLLEKGALNDCNLST